MYFSFLFSFAVVVFTLRQRIAWITRRREMAWPQSWMFLSWKFCWFFVDAKIHYFWLPALKWPKFPHNIKLAYLCTQSICLVLSPAKHTCFIHTGLTKSYKNLPTIKTIKKNNWPLKLLTLEETHISAGIFWHIWNIQQKQIKSDVMIRVSIQRNLWPTNQPFHFNQTLNVSYVMQFKLKTKQQGNKRRGHF